jgi:predicted AAA+ superfamily ATPase
MQLRLRPASAPDSGVLEQVATARRAPMPAAKDETMPAGLEAKLERLIAAVERLTPAAPRPADLTAADCFVWNAETVSLDPVPRVNRVALELIRAVEHVRDILLDNTRRFAAGLPANNALLWGARGMGKSSLVKAVHAAINAERSSGEPLKLIEIHREDVGTLPQLMATLKAAPFRFVLFCDDLSFDHDDTSYKSLKAALEGGVEGRPDNVVFYATSNRRHLLPRDMIDNERSTAINPSEAVEEKVSLSDRFGLWLGFHKCSQDDYLAMIDGYAGHFGLAIDHERLRAEALEWATTRGGRSGRVAWQFVQDLAGRLGQKLETASSG